MTPNQLALLVDVHTGRYSLLTRGNYPETLENDLRYLCQWGYLNDDAFNGLVATVKGTAFVNHACRLRVTEVTTWEITLP